MNIIRVFPRRTKATPVDENVSTQSLPGLFDEADEIHISVTFSWDLPRAERLEKLWKHVAVTKIGGPATGERSGEFVSGMYIKKGYTITSRGCPNRCWFCSVPKREGTIREISIVPGHNVLDDNLLACSRPHIENVFLMLSEQKRLGQSIEFTGGLEAARLEDWHVDALYKLRPKQLFFAYDTPDDYEPLLLAGKKLQAAGFSRKSHNLRCYVLCGFPKDSLEEAEIRMYQAISAGFMPMAMVLRNPKTGKRPYKWCAFQRQWARPHIVGRKMSEYNK